MLFRSAVILAAVAASPAVADLKLHLFEQPGCHWCEAWDREISPIYGRTGEGRAAPLVRHPLQGPPPAGLALTRPAALTPTFVLAEDGQEVGRIEGYPGESFFWALLGRMLAQRPPG